MNTKKRRMKERDRSLWAPPPPLSTRESMFNVRIWGRQGVAGRGVAWRGVAWFGVAWRDAAR